MFREEGIDIRPRLARFVLAGIAFAVLVHGTARAQGIEQFSVSDDNRGAIEDAVLEIDNPDPFWGSKQADVRCPGFGHVSVLLHVDAPEDPARVAELLRIAKRLLADSILGHEGELNAKLADGTVRGLELFFLGAGEPFAAPAGALDLRGELIALDAEGQPFQVGVVHAFDASGLAARGAELAALQGSPELDVHDIWVGPTLRGTGSGASIYLSGEGNVIRGGARADADVQTFGLEHQVDDLRWGGTATLRAKDSSMGHASQDLALVTAETAPDLAALFDRAVAQGTYFAEDLLLIEADAAGLPRTSEGVSLQGKVVYCTGMVVLAAAGLDGQLTVVSEERIDLSGTGCRLRAAEADVLFFVPGAEERVGINLAGEAHSLVGEIHAPLSVLELSATGSSFTGIARAARLRLTGSGNTLDDGTASAPR